MCPSGSKADWGEKVKNETEGTTQSVEISCRRTYRAVRLSGLGLRKLSRSIAPAVHSMLLFPGLDVIRFVTVLTSTSNIELYVVQAEGAPAEKASQIATQMRSRRNSAVLLLRIKSRLPL